jgi:tRNA pseudouridine55 synthase
VICFGKATKDIAFLQDDDKTYDVEFVFGARSTTDDRAGEITETPNVTPCTEEQVVNALRSFEGTIQQTPPDYSAVRHQGRRQYDLAREGKEFTPKTRTVRIDPITNIDVAWPYVRCTISCSKGTYIRSIARDCGELLGCGAYVTKLRRTRSGGFTVDDACTVGDVIEVLPQGVVV